MNKKCNKCLKEKLISEFHRKSVSKDSFNSRCKVCRLKDYYANREQYLARSKRWKIKNKEYINSKDYKLKKKEYNNKYWKENREKFKENGARWRENNREKIREQMLLWRLENGARLKKYARRNYLKAKIRALIAYSGGKLECKCCGEKDIRFLTLDHINNDGNKDRKDGKGGYSYFVRLAKEGFPRKDLQILCYNCNCGKRMYNICPHNVKTDEDINYVKKKLDVI